MADSSSSTDAVSVVCAWPLSGQYGVGSRLLYYALVFMCIVGVKMEWMRSVGMAATLILPAVAAVHAIVIVVYSTHTDGAVDLDLFGAFQVCSIAVLAVPVTLRYSRTYWQTTGRNLVFLWTLLLLAGLLSLAVGFGRVKKLPCLDSGYNVTYNEFEGGNQDCDSRCAGKKTGIRQDPQNPSQYVLDMHHGITTNTGLGLSVACCIPTILSMASIWLKLVREKLAHLTTLLPPWSDEGSNMLAASTDEIQREEIKIVTPDQKRRHEEKKMDSAIRIGLGLVERIVFSAAILGIVVLGERNFWSQEMRVGVEPMSSVGQWAPILGAVIGALGSWYKASTDSIETVKLPRRQTYCDSCNGYHDPNADKACLTHNEHYTGEVSQASSFLGVEDPQLPPVARLRDHTHQSTPSTIHRTSVPDVNSHRTAVDQAIKRLGDWLTPAPDRFLDDIMKTEGHDRYREYPHTPGEEDKNPHLAEQDRLHREHVLSFAARASPPRSPVLDPSQPGPSGNPAPSTTLLVSRRPSSNYLSVPSRSHPSPPYRTPSLPPESDDDSIPVASSSSPPPKIVVTDTDVAGIV